MRFTTLMCLLLLVGCGQPAGSPEDALREWINQGELAAEDKNRGLLLEMISENYADARGNDYKSVGDLLRIYFLRQNSIALLTNIENITVSGQTAATIALTIGMAGTSNAALGISADAYNFEFELVKPKNDWLLIGARWGELGRELH